MKADLHIHSIYSHDAISKPETILEIAAARGLNFIAITDHNPLPAWQHFDGVADKYPVHVIRGQEIKLHNGKYLDGEIIGLFLKEPIISTKMPDILAEIRSQGGIASIARPFCDRRGEFRAFDQIDDWSRIAIEAKNGRIYKERNNEMAAGLADRLNLPVTAGSDAHTPFEIGSVHLEFDGDSVQDLKAAILHRDVRIVGGPANALFSLISSFGRLGIAI
ncbi:PHP domain-containing protein [candidate division KSB1 bacterium]|nr:PHP domain-containing protein [candidate division KSB1 bacterium]RQW02772.1 MAG: PHP domain-containing protein [candidate division KSB1 bacterium]